MPQRALEMSHFGRRGREGVKFEGLTPTSSHWGGREGGSGVGRLSSFVKQPGNSFILELDLFSDLQCSEQIEGRKRRSV